MAVSAILLGLGTVFSFYLIFDASGANLRSVLTAIALLVASCSCAVFLLLLGTPRFRDRRSRTVVGIPPILAAGWFIYSLPTWIGQRSWWAVVISLWAVGVVAAMLFLLWTDKRPPETKH
jgi:hypothetical protein